MNSGVSDTPARITPVLDADNSEDSPNAVVAASAESISESAKKKKQKKKKKQSASSIAIAAPTDMIPSASVVQAVPSLPSFKSSMQKLAESLAQQGVFEVEDEDDKTALKPTDSYKFWKTQPVPKTEEVVEEDGVIEIVDRSMVRQTPYDLNAQFEWCLIDVNDENQLKETYELLTENYVEDKDSSFRFDYSREFLKWAIQPPGWKKSWHLGVRVKQSQKLVAFISAIPGDLMIRQLVNRIVEINFLCVHKKLRSKRLSPLLIKEITRQVNLEGIFQAAYTAGKVIPTPISQCRYWHRSLNFKKLVEVGFSYVPKNSTMAQMILKLKLPKVPEIPGTRPLEIRDIQQVKDLLSTFLSSRTDVYPVFAEEEIAHWFIPIKDVVYSYVVEDPETGRITDFYSFYNLPSSILKHDKHNHLRAAYLFYYAPKGFGENSDRTKKLIKDALILAHANNFDVFNCLDLMGNGVFLDDLQFGKGDGILNYYLYNYRCRPVENGRMGLVLL
ncbi:Glycylpeptide N-tetradecanoyltransferase 2 [Entophlyctis luteolus]|nr:Glycylpeptide N-tetradecanoyltransferase 2 [Entophlyctis luteolus]